MASHGGRREGSGRKRIFENSAERIREWRIGHQRIYLDIRVYSSWFSCKTNCGYSTDSEFARHLLALEYRRREETKSSKKIPDVEFATPSKRPKQLDNRSSDVGLYTSTPIPKSFKYPDRMHDDTSSTTIDITGISVCSQEESLSDNKSINDTSSDEGDDEADNEISTAALDLALQDLNDDHSYDEDSDSGESFQHFDSFEDDESEEDSFYQDVISVAKGVEASTQTSLIHDPVLTSCSSEEVIEQPFATSSTSSQAQGRPCYLTKFKRADIEPKLQEELQLVKETKVICSLNRLLDVFKSRCGHAGCARIPSITHHINGPSITVNWSCTAGHKGKFCSSSDVNGILANNLQAAAAVLLSGNNFIKIEKMANFLGLSFISESTFYRMQRLYIIPAVNEWWTWQRDLLLKEFIGKELVVAGDGQCDSPGHSAKNLCYFLMELSKGYILEVEIRDKRHVGLASSNMEKQALQNALKRLKETLEVVELVTDASSTIKKLLETDFPDVFHSLDVWHKTKSIRKCLAKVSALKGMKKVKDWTDHIIRHFWYCCSVCKANEEVTDQKAEEILKDKWIGLLHHVTNSHEWVGGQCDHDSMIDHEALEWFDRRDKDFEALQKVILDPNLLSSFKYYVRFRHTGSIECVNSLSLAYATKRCSYSYKAYKTRKQLAAIDWNFHLELPTATSKSGEVVVSRKFNQRTREWTSKTVKTKKEYEYIPNLTANILKLRMDDIDIMGRHVSLNESDPALIAPTIAPKPPPPSRELFIKSKSRFEKIKGRIDKKDEESKQSQ